VVISTGRSRGLGLALAPEFARRGARGAMCARNGAELNRVRTEFEYRRLSFAGFKCNVGVRSEIQQTVSMVGHIDVLVNIARWPSGKSGHRGV